MVETGARQRLPIPSKKEALILGMLREAELFGLQMVERSAGGLKKGTVYVTLSRMTDKGFLDSRQEEKLPGSIGLPRRLYRITRLGEQVYQAWDTYGLYGEKPSTQAEFATLP